MSSASDTTTTTSTTPRQNPSIKKSPRRGHKIKLSPDFEPNPYTVLCGRGREYYDSIGNRRFRVLVGQYLERYSHARTKAEKTRLVWNVVETIRTAGGGFVQRTIRGDWYDIGEDAAREKVGAQFRDCLYKQYKSATRSRGVAARRHLTGEEGWDDRDVERDTREPRPTHTVYASDHVSVASDLSSDKSRSAATASIASSSFLAEFFLDDGSASSSFPSDAEIIFDPQSLFPF